ncbi:metal-dependent hydrolase [Marinimicrobium alkaliphilum]|uniref:metal-dependent hydrolase n=1 Tax=Marinimicrobium alkaliphilum TaxID=2202654 RepID=UPI00130082E3|nr:metal-dependent hydrolase [Marinimicrobium alkaliphilum]
MDLVTHGLLGAVTAQSASRPDEQRAAMGVGFFAALLADLDVFIRSSTDPLLVLEYHRQFSHSLIFIPVGALIASLIAWPFVRRQLAPLRLYLFAFLAYASAGLLDACTSYGVHLFWPLVDNPVALSLIAVVDPVFSLILLSALMLAFFRRDKRWGIGGLVLALGYLSLAGVQHYRALQITEQLAQERGVSAERLLVKPTMANLVLWRAMTDTGEEVYLDAVRVGLGSYRVYEGSVTVLIDPDHWGNLPEDSRAYRDLQRFHRYAHQWLAAAPDQPHYIGDIRYAMLPTSDMPLWGIVLNPDDPDGPIDFMTRRDMSPEMRERWLDMLRGRDVPAARP